MCTSTNVALTIHLVDQTICKVIRGHHKKPFPRLHLSPLIRGSGSVHYQYHGGDNLSSAHTSSSTSRLCQKVWSLWWWGHHTRHNLAETMNLTSRDHATLISLTSSSGRTAIISSPKTDGIIHQNWSCPAAPFTLQLSCFVLTLYAKLLCNIWVTFRTSNTSHADTRQLN